MRSKGASACLPVCMSRLCPQDVTLSCGQSRRRRMLPSNRWMHRWHRLSPRSPSVWLLRRMQPIFTNPLTDPVTHIMVSNDSAGLARHQRRSFATAMSGVCVAAIRWYQRVISPCFPARCKYYPTCSSYALTAIERFGVIRGVALAAARLLRCQPWNTGGIDDVPATFSLFYRFTWSKAHEANDADSSDDPISDCGSTESDVTASTNTTTGKETVA